jgi:hypothetical protein
MGVKIFETVNTIYGPGFVKEVRDDCYVVSLINWALAQGQSPTLYLQLDAITKIPGAFPGTTVATTYGPSRVESIRADGTHIARPINWKLANDTSATLYLQPETIKLDQSPGFIQGDEVMTVYGQGYIEKVRTVEGDLVVKLNEWALAQGQSPTLYLSPSACVKVPGLKIGAVAKTVWGLVRVKSIRRCGTHVCTAMHWNLADGTPPTFYIAPEAFALKSLKP